MAGTSRFERIRDQLEKLFAETGEPVARRATAAALLHHKIPSVSWTGFYLLHDGELIVDVYQGPVACLHLQAHTGVCWAAIDRGEPLIVPDVHAFPGHIPCDARTRSELVVPLHRPDGTPAGVLDIDSTRPHRFTPADLEGYILIARFLEEHRAI
ncbi:MAG: GAF domain-containing protein [Acidobacteria bacterium]|nr:GAF domain-containing protein [Acidobacteriota bacterium]